MITREVHEKLIPCVFFFSSRRRHTRLQGDWSSDVCSSDLNLFRALSIGPDEAQHKFGFLLEALQYGAPPHGGIAFGLDRIVAMIAGTESIRDVIAFPKTHRGQDLLTHAPSPAAEKQFAELTIRLGKP